MEHKLRQIEKHFQCQPAFLVSFRLNPDFAWIFANFFSKLYLHCIACNFPLLAKSSVFNECEWNTSKENEKGKSWMKWGGKSVKGFGCNIWTNRNCSGKVSLHSKGCHPPFKVIPRAERVFVVDLFHVKAAETETGRHRLCQQEELGTWMTRLTDTICQCLHSK
jgi:hypothetical protein